jgi:hypothetical protein
LEPIKLRVSSTTTQNYLIHSRLSLLAALYLAIYQKVFHRNRYLDSLFQLTQHNLHSRKRVSSEHPHLHKWQLIKKSPQAPQLLKDYHCLVMSQLQFMRVAIRKGKVFSHRQIPYRKIPVEERHSLFLVSPHHHPRLGLQQPEISLNRIGDSLELNKIQMNSSKQKLRD